MSDLQSLEQLKGLTQLKLDLIGSQVSDLKPLRQFKLTELSMALSNTEVSNLESVWELPNLQTFSIEDATRAQRMSLRNIPASLVELKF